MRIGMHRWLLLAVLAAGLLGSISAAAAEPLNVVATFSILQDFVKQVGGGEVAVQALVPLGADPHTWEPSPREAALLADADLVVANGGGFDDWLLRLVRNAAKPGVPILLVAEELGPAEGGGSHHGHDHGADPHLWLSVPNAISYVETIAAFLAEVSPERAAVFAERSSAYIDELRALDAKLTQELGQIPPEQRVIITYHNAFSYFAERYGFAVVEFLVRNPDAEPNPRDLGRLVGLLQRLEKPAVFSEPQLTSGARYLEALARDAGAEVYVLFSDSLTAEVPTYVQMMEYNLRVLMEALR